MGGKRDGELLLLAEGEFDVLLTVDRRLRYQQNLAVFNIAVIVMMAATNRLLDLQPLMPGAVEKLSDAKRGQVTVVRD